MGKPAARLTDLHICPMVTPGLPPIPHVGGPITGTGATNVLIGGLPAAVMSDMCACVGPIGNVTLGSSGVFFNGKPAARMGDITAHGGVISTGLPSVTIGEANGGTGSAGLLGIPVDVLLNALEKLPADAVTSLQNMIVGMKNATESGAKWVGANFKVTPGGITPSPGSLDISGLNFALGKLVKGELDHIVLSGAASINSNEINLAGSGEIDAVDVKSGSYNFMGTSNTDEVKVGTAEANATFNVTKSYVDVGLGASAGIANYEHTQTEVIPLPFNNNITIVVKAGGTAGGIGADAEVKAGLDPSDDRYHLGIAGALSALVGFDLDFDVSFGKNSPPSS